MQRLHIVFAFRGLDQGAKVTEGGHLVHAVLRCVWRHNLAAKSGICLGWTAVLGFHEGQGNKVGHALRNPRNWTILGYEDRWPPRNRGAAPGSPAVVVFIGLFFMFDWRLAIVLGVVSAVFYVVAIVAGFLGLFRSAPVRRELSIAGGHRRLGVTERYAEHDPQYLKEVTAAIEDFGSERLRTVICGKLVPGEGIRTPY